MNKKLHSAIIVAAGRSTRFNHNIDKDQVIPKQYLKIDGLPMIEHSIKIFSEHPGFSAILVVIHPDDQVLFDEIHTRWPEVNYCYGGATRQDSVKNGLDALSPAKPDTVFIHDAARPLQNSQLINEMILLLESNDAVCPLSATVNSVKSLQNHQITNHLDRSTIWQAHTPQAFQYDLILDAHKSADHQQNSDDISLIDPEKFKIYGLKTDQIAEKITYGADMQQSQIRVGQGFDVHAFSKTTSDHPIKLCGVEIEHPHDLVGHSDADVGLHAITDAILGAIGEGDIGEHFPPSDDQWKDRDSSEFILYAMKLLQEKKAKLINIDVTFICQTPKIQMHKQKMVEKLAKLLDISPDVVNVKATTTENLGFLGRQEGIACQAISLTEQELR